MACPSLNVEKLINLVKKYQFLYDKNHKYYCNNILTRWENNIKHDLREVDYTGDDWKILAEDREVWRAYVHAVINLRVR